MSKRRFRDLITDQEMKFANLILSGTMTDSQAAEAMNLPPGTAACIKAKPRVRAYMIERQAAMNEKHLQKEGEELRRQNQGRERILARLWQIADLGPEMTRNSMSAQIKALSMIVAIEGIIPDHRAGSSQNKSVPPPRQPQTGTSASLHDQQGQPFNPAATTPSAPPAPVSASAPEIQVPSATEKKPDTWRLRL